MGNLNEADDGSFMGRFVLSGRDVSVSVRADGGDIADALAFARTIASSFAEFDSAARHAAARSLLNTYNANWRDYSEVGLNGENVPVSRPRLGAEDFAEKLRLDSVRIMGDECCDFHYNAADLFWGHTVVMTSFDAATTWEDGDLHG